MPDYVDREAVLREITETAVVNFCEDDAWYEETVAAVKAIPAADVVEVVRCRECKKPYYDATILNGELTREIYWCNRTPHHGDFFCADGERKESSNA